MVSQRMLHPSCRAEVAPRWQGELREAGFGIFSSQGEKCFVAAEICFVAEGRMVAEILSPAFCGDSPSWLHRLSGIGYDLILVRPTPPPSAGKASFMQGHFHHRTNCSSTKHKEGL
jgi:hypothetical protein